MFDKTGGKVLHESFFEATFGKDFMCSLCMRECDSGKKGVNGVKI